MSSITSVKITTEIMLGEGYYFNDPHVTRIYSYMSPEGERNFKLLYMHQTDPFLQGDTSHCADVTLLWSFAAGSTEAGKALLKEAGIYKPHIFG